MEVELSQLSLVDSVGSRRPLRASKFQVFASLRQMSRANVAILRQAYLEDDRDQEGGANELKGRLISAFAHSTGSNVHLPN